MPIYEGKFIEQSDGKVGETKFLWENDTLCCMMMCM